jgi:hypothetical protein
LGATRERHPLKAVRRVRDPRKNAAGDITSYRVKWRLGGNGPQQSERFGDEESAGIFRDAVDEYEQ